MQNENMKKSGGQKSSDPMTEGLELLRQTGQDIKGLRNFFEENWRAILTTIMTATVTAFLAHAIKPND